jgi:hypothetical protein
MIDYIRVNIADTEFMQFVLGRDYMGIEDDYLVYNDYGRLKKAKHGEYIFNINNCLMVYRECDFKIAVRLLTKYKDIML